MKKLAGLLLTAVLVMGMGTVVFAAPSVTNTTTALDGTTAEGAVITHDFANATPEVKAEAEAAGIVVVDGKTTIASTEVTKITETLKTENVVKKGETVKVLDVFNVEAPAGFVVGTPTKITIAGVKWQEGLVILHFEDGDWKALPTTHDGDTVYAEFTKFSPTAVAVIAKADTTGTVGTTDGSAATSPKTGEGSNVLFAIVIALVGCVAGCAVYRRKRA